MKRPALYSVALHEQDVTQTKVNHNLKGAEARNFILANLTHPHIQVVRTQTTYIGPAKDFDWTTLTSDQ